MTNTEVCNPQRRASDGVLSANPTNADIVKLILEMQKQFDAAILNHTNISRAFKKNRYGEPDYDHHYDVHDKEELAIARSNEYKTGMTKTALDWAVKFLLAAMLVGITAKVTWPVTTVLEKIK